MKTINDTHDVTIKMRQRASHVSRVGKPTSRALAKTADRVIKIIHQKQM
jgi:hypothetical protein